jgi:hypothetical protein
MLFKHKLTLKLDFNKKIKEWVAANNLVERQFLAYFIKFKNQLTG